MKQEKRKIIGYIIEVPDKNNSAQKTEKFISGKSVAFFDRNKVIRLVYDKNSIPQKSNSQERTAPYNEQEMTKHIASEVQRIMEENERAKKVGETKNKTKPKKVSKPKLKSKKSNNRRYTASKDRAFVARIINRIRYNSGYYDDIEDDLIGRYVTFRDVEASKNAEKRREKKLYKKVQAYEDARDDITMDKVFLGVKITAASALLIASFLAVNSLEKEFNDNNNYAITQSENGVTTLDSANSNQIESAEKALSGIEYVFEYLDHSELVDGVLRIQRQASKITENKARATIFNIGLSSDQQLLKDILEEVYEEDEYNSFSDEEKQELMQLTYELLDENAKGWIRSPERVAEANTKQESSQNNRNTENTDFEIGD